MDKLKLAVVIFFGAFMAFKVGGVVWDVLKPQKVYADQASLTYSRPAAGDIIQIWRNGQAVGVNWTQFSRQLTQDINWVGLNTTTGAINWNYVGQ